MLLNGDVNKLLKLKYGVVDTLELVMPVIKVKYMTAWWDVIICPTFLRQHFLKCIIFVILFKKDKS